MAQQRGSSTSSKSSLKLLTQRNYAYDSCQTNYQELLKHTQTLTQLRLFAKGLGDNFAALSAEGTIMRNELERSRNYFVKLDYVQKQAIKASENEFRSVTVAMKELSDALKLSGQEDLKLPVCRVSAED